MTTTPVWPSLGAELGVEFCGAELDASVVGGAATGAAVLGCPTGASIMARITLSGTPLAFRFFSEVGAVSKAQALDLILAIRTSAGRPALDISEISALES